MGPQAGSWQASNPTLPPASLAMTSPRALLSSPTSKAPSWTRQSGSGLTSSALVRGEAGCLWAGAAQAVSQPLLTLGLSSCRPLSGPWRKPQCTGLRLRGTHVPGRAAGTPGALRGAGASAAGLHAAAASRRPALPAAPPPLRCQPHHAAFPGAAAAPGGSAPRLGRVPVTGRMHAGLALQFLLLLLLYKPLPSPPVNIVL